MTNSAFIAAVLLLSSSFPAAAQTLSFVESMDFAVGVQPVSLAADDFNGDTVIDLVVANSRSDSISVLLSNRDGTFQPAQIFDAGSTPQSVAIGDLNRDGLPDLAIADYFGGVSVLLGNGDGTFQSARMFPAGANPESVTAGDFNRDGMIDLAVANYSSNDVAVLEGNGDGTFQAARIFAAAGRHPMSVAANDFNGDGVPDLAIANVGDPFVNTDFGNISVMLGRGDGTFQSAQTLSAGLQPISVAIGDFNDDRHLDLVAANFRSQNVSILLGNGDGTFQTHRDFAPSLTSDSYPRSVTVADVNGDGKCDLAVARNGSEGTGNNNNVVSVLLGNGDGTFQEPLIHVGGGPPVSVTTGDFSADGVPDLALANLTANSVSVMLGNGDGTFHAVRTFGPGGFDTAVGDMNGDGVPDVAVADLSSTVSMLLGNGDGTFRTGLTFAVGTFPYALAIADFNGDGKRDLAVACAGATEIDPGNISVLLGNGDGTFQPAQPFAAGITPVSIVAGDFNGDGVPDLATANWGDDTASLLVGNGDGTFQATRAVAAGPSPRSVAASDFNTDGKLDLAIANYGNPACSANGCFFVDSSVLLLLGNGDGTFQAGSTLAAIQGPFSVAVADFNGDQQPDLVVTANGDTADSNNVAVMLGNGDGTFRAPLAFAVSGYPWTSTVGDFNGDGAQDLAVPTSGTTVLLGNGDGSFQPGQAFAPYDAFSATVGDFNGDGKLDLVTNSVAVLMNNTASATHNVEVSKNGKRHGDVLINSRRTD
jgi:hypothetical protein